MKRTDVLKTTVEDDRGNANMHTPSQHVANSSEKDEDVYVENIDLKGIKLAKEINFEGEPEMRENEVVLRANGTIDVESIRTKGKGESISEGNLNSTVPGTEFAGIVDSDEAVALRESIDKKKPIYMDSTGVINVEAMKNASKGTSSLEKTNINKTVPGSEFAGIVDSDEADVIRKTIDKDGVVLMNSKGELDLEAMKRYNKGDSSLKKENLNITVRGTTFAAQWYQSNPMLFEAEKEGMKKHYPGAKLGYLKDGRAYWLLTLNITIDKKITPWTVMLVYDSDHPNNKDYGGSCKAFPIKPTIKEINERAKRLGKAYVPHIIPESMSPVDGPYLCTARRNDVGDGNNEISTAVTTASWTAKWAYFYEIGLYDSKVWTEFCKHHNN